MFPYLIVIGKQIKLDKESNLFFSKTLFGENGFNV